MGLGMPDRQLVCADPAWERASEDIPESRTEPDPRRALERPQSWTRVAEIRPETVECRSFGFTMAAGVATVRPSAGALPSDISGQPLRRAISLYVRLLRLGRRRLEHQRGLSNAKSIGRLLDRWRPHGVAEHSQMPLQYFDSNAVAGDSRMVWQSAALGSGGGGHR